MQEARFYETLDDKKVQCHLCPHECVIAPDKTGLCKVRRNTEGVLYSLIYGEYTSANLDPIEKKPLYHFYPGEHIFSIGTYGCNFTCEFCQNWQISQEVCDTRTVLPKEIVDLCLSRGSIGIAYTYNEPTIWYEFVYDCSAAAHEANLVNALVTNGYISPEPLRELLPHVDAMNIDLKSFRDAFYKKTCGGRLQPVLDTIATASKRTHVELTTLIVPGQNDDPAEWDEAARWIAENASPDTPLHLSAYTPRYKMKEKATTPQVLEDARKAYRKYLNYVYLGNVITADGGHTLCPGCNEVLIARSGYDVEVKNLKGDVCTKCNVKVPIVSSRGNENG